MVVFKLTSEFWSKKNFPAPAPRTNELFQERDEGGGAGRAAGRAALLYPNQMARHGALHLPSLSHSQSEAGPLQSSGSGSRGQSETWVRAGKKKNQTLSGFVESHEEIVAH